MPPCLRSPEIWEVSLAFLQDRRKIATIGAQCNTYSHKHRWPIEELIVQNKPWTTVVELARRWRCVLSPTLRPALRS
jgi:hypothetical protein